MKKATVMKPKTITREILLFTVTRFSSNKFCLKNSNSKKTTDLSSLEHLERNCWAGLLFEMLPELTSQDGAGNKNFIWNIMNGKNFLCICMGPSPPALETESSIDPYLFQQSIFNN